MDARHFRRRLARIHWLILLSVAAFAVPGADSNPFQLRGTVAAAEPLAEKPPASPADPAAEPDARKEKAKPAFRVVDDEGSPIAKFQYIAWFPDGGSSGFMTGRDGKGPLREFPTVDSLDLTLLAAGYASTVQHFAAADLEKLKTGETTIVMHRGEEVEVDFRLPPGMTWPDGLEPILYFDSVKRYPHSNWSVPMLRHRKNGERVSDLMGVRSPKPGTATLRLSAESAPFRVGIHSPGFLQYFERGPFTLADFKDGKLTIDVEKPASLDVQFDPTATAGETLPIASSAISVRFKLPGSGLPFEATEGNPSPEPKQHVRLSDLPAGDYVIEVRTTARRGVKSLSDNPPIPVNPGTFTASKKVTLTAGQSERIEVPYTPLDPEAFKGDRTAVIHILKGDGSPPRAQTVTVLYNFEHYGLLPAFSGTTSESGTVTLTGISDRKPEGSKSGPYTVSFGGQTLGRFGFQADSTTKEFTFRLPPVVGDMAPDIALVNISTGAAAKLSDFRGKVVCLDFWATWCGPCQEPLRKMNLMSAQRREGWKDRAVIVPISIDDSPDLVIQHIAARGWNNLEYFWSGNDGVGGWDSPAPLAFGIHGVPTSFIIDRDGKILWRGHPSDIDKSDGKDLEGRIDAAIEK